MRKRLLLALVIALPLAIMVLGLAAVMYYHVGERIEEPEQRHPAYEGALAAEDGVARVGTNAVRIASVVRNDRDGTLKLAQGSELPEYVVKNRDVLTSAGPWLDVVVFELAADPGTIDIIEARLFDSATGEPVGSRGFGLVVPAPNIVQLHSLDASIPPRVDLWLRAASFNANDPVVTLAAQQGATASFPPGQVVVEEIYEGRGRDTRSWGVDSGWPFHATITLAKADGALGVNQQLCIVTRDGRHVHPSGFHFLDIRDSLRWTIHVPVTIEEVSHFELRPFGGRNTFFFPEVELTPPTRTDFSDRPSATIDLIGEEMRTEQREFAPLMVKLRVDLPTTSTMLVYNYFRGIDESVDLVHPFDENGQPLLPRMSSESYQRTEADGFRTEVLEFEHPKWPSQLELRID